MDFSENLLLAIADKLLIGVVLLIAGLWLNVRLERLKGQIGLQTALAQARAEAFGSLWSATQPLSPYDEGVLPTPEDCRHVFTEMRTWYYSKAGAMHLSFAAARQCMLLLAALERADGRGAKQHASALRTQLKVDMGVYTQAESGRPLLNDDERARLAASRGTC